MTPAVLLHRSSARVRLHVPGERGNDEFFADLGQRLITCDDVVRFDARPRTGSVILGLIRPWDHLLQTAVEESGALAIADAASAYDPLTELHLDGFALRGEAPRLGASVLVALAVFQARRGKFLPAGLTLALQGWDLLSGAVGGGHATSVDVRTASKVP